jgi:hypothetical protein
MHGDNPEHVSINGTFYSGMTQNLSNDFAIFRYADILLMKAELAARKKR